MEQEEIKQRIDHIMETGGPAMYEQVSISLTVSQWTMICGMADAAVAGIETTALGPILKELADTVTNELIAALTVRGLIASESVADHGEVVHNAPIASKV